MWLPPSPFQVYNAMQLNFLLPCARLLQAMVVWLSCLLHTDKVNLAITHSVTVAQRMRTIKNIRRSDAVILKWVWRQLWSVKVSNNIFTTNANWCKMQPFHTLLKFSSSPETRRPLYCRAYKRFKLGIMIEALTYDSMKSKPNVSLPAPCNLKNCPKSMLSWLG